MFRVSPSDMKINFNILLKADLFFYATSRHFAPQAMMEEFNITGSEGISPMAFCSRHIHGAIRCSSSE
jgi:hypothetical protein